MKNGIELIANERKRQIESEGYNLRRDKMNWGQGQLAMAAASYVTPAFQRMTIGDRKSPYCFPFRDEFWKPTPENRIRELVKAGALILAEIDRLQNLQKL